jgi:hypothetical protein
MALPEIVIGSKLDAKGFKQAESATDKLGRSVKNLAKTLGLAFSAAAILSYGKAAVRASLEAQAQQQRLAALLKVTNGATQQQVDVLNDQALALEKIGVVTGGNVTQVQSQLATFDLQIATIKALTPAILDYVTAEKGAAASASDFKSMTNGLAQALNGNFTSLTRTGFVLDEVTKNLIKNGTEAERAEALIKVLNSTYKDFNKNLRDTPAGQFQVLANSAEQAKEVIGTGLLEAFGILNGKQGIGGTVEAMDKFSNTIADALKNIAYMLKQFEALKPIIIAVGALLLIYFAPVFAAVAALTFLIAKGGQNLQAAKLRQYGPAQQSPGQRIAIDKANKEAVKLQKTKNTLSKIDNENTARRLTLTGDQKALLELEKKFDVERVGLYSALNQSTDGETRMRLLSLIAIHDQNTALAGMIKKANEAEDAFGAFTEAMRATIRGMLDAIASAMAALQVSVAVTPTPQGFQAFTPSPGGYEGFGSGMSNLGQNNYGGLAGAGQYGGGGAPVINYNINASGIGDQQIASVVQNAIQDLNRYGNSTTYAGAI